jgi:hypothetical protein
VAKPFAVNGGGYRAATDHRPQIRLILTEGSGSEIDCLIAADDAIGAERRLCMLWERPGAGGFRHLPV